MEQLLITRKYIKLLFRTIPIQCDIFYNYFKELFAQLADSIQFFYKLLMESEQINQSLGFADQYTLHHVLGTGGQASVYVGSKQGELYAIKVYMPGASKELAFQQQAQFLKKLHFPLLINLVQSRPRAVIKINNLPQQRRPVLVLELAQGLDLFEYIHKFGRFSAEVCRYYAKQIISTLRYLVDQNITHRDLKPQNILLDTNFNIKISDFGLARDSKGDLGNGELRSRVGTQGYRPPEMELGKYTGIQADIFALGVIIFIMYKGSPPFLSTKPHDRVYRLIRQNEFSKFWQLHEKEQPPGFFPDSFKRLLNSFFCFDPEKRPTFESLENDEWLEGPDLTHDLVIKEMKEKFQPLSEDNPIRQLRLKLLHQKMNEEKCKKCEDEDETRQERCQSDEEGQELTIQQKFIKTANKLNIKLEQLPEFESNRNVYLNEDPSFVVAWVKDYIGGLQKEKEVFLKDFVGQIRAHKFYFKYHKKRHIIQLSFSFYAGEEHDESEVELELTGQVHKSGRREVGVEWKKAKGNFYWLTAIETKLDEGLKALN